MTAWLDAATFQAEGHSCCGLDAAFDWQETHVSGKLGEVSESPLAESKEPNQTCR